jgi:hypothetical protein
VEVGCALLEKTLGVASNGPGADSSDVMGGIRYIGSLGVLWTMSGAGVEVGCALLAKKVGIAFNGAC